MSTRILNTIRDTEMELSVTMAEKTMTVEELYNLGPGTVISFERLIDEPFSLTVNGKKFAKGTVISQRQFYAFRVEELIEK